MLTRPRLDPPSAAVVRARLAAINFDHEVFEPAEADLLAFFHPATLRQIKALRAWLLDDQERINPVDDWIRMVAINRLIVH